MANVLIIGCGYVGSALGAALAGEDHLVWGMRRNPENLPESIKPLGADVHDKDLSDFLPKGLDFIFYTLSSGGGGEPATGRRMPMDPEISSKRLIKKEKDPSEFSSPRARPSTRKPMVAGWMRNHLRSQPIIRAASCWKASVLYWRATIPPPSCVSRAFTAPAARD